MSIGDGIFAGLVFVGLVWLYVATKDRWRWRRFAKTAGIVIMLPVLALAGWATYEKVIGDRPVRETVFWGLEPRMALSEVTFRKGEPNSNEAGGWTYGGATSDVVYRVQTKNGKVRYVLAFATTDERQFALPSIQGISSHSTQEEIEAKFGKPDSQSETADHTRRLLNYSRYGVVFGLERNKVLSLGVFDPAEGPLQFADSSNVAR